MSKQKKSINSITHKDNKRKNIPTAEYENFMNNKETKTIELKYPRNPDLDPQLVWRGKDDQDWSDLVVTAPPIYIQEKINPKHIIDNLINQSKKRIDDKEEPDLFANMFDGELDPEAKTEFYAHDQNWTNRMILGDSLQVMASLAEREGLLGKVQCIYFDPPYGIKFGSNWQVSTQSRDVKDGKSDQISREPEMVKAFRDTWSDGIHSYLTYLRDRLTLSRDLLTESGSIFVQIGDENVHRVRALLDEVFGDENFISQIQFRTAWTRQSNTLDNLFDSILWYSKNKSKLKFRRLFEKTTGENENRYDWVENNLGNFDLKTKSSLSPNSRLYFLRDLTSQGESEKGRFNLNFQKNDFFPRPGRSWSTRSEGLERLRKSNRLQIKGKNIFYRYFADDFPIKKFGNVWNDTAKAGFLKQEQNVYVVQTATSVIQRCILMTTDPGDIVLDPTCGSGTTAYVSEAWGRRWITIDSSRVAMTIARTRLSSANFPSYLLYDSAQGCKLRGVLPENEDQIGTIRSGFVYEHAPHIKLSTIANNTEIDVIWENFQKILEPIHQQLNKALNQNWEEWEIPSKVEDNWPKAAKSSHSKYWEVLSSRQKEIDESIALNAETEYLYDQPYVDNSKVRVAGPFTVESLSPHKVIAVDDDSEFLSNNNTVNDQLDNTGYMNNEIDFTNVILEHLRTAGVQQAHKEDRIKFTSIKPFPGRFIAGDGRYNEIDIQGAPEKRAAIFIGPEYGILGRVDIVTAAREARDLKFDVLVCCAFNYDAHSSEIDQLANLPILKARMNPDLHMADELKNTGAGNLFVVFGEPDIEFIKVEGGKIQIKIHGVDVFHPSKGEVISGGPESIAAWFIDTDYNEESFFVRHAYFLGANDPYKQLKSALKAEIDEEAWESLYRNVSRPFPKPETGRIAVKVINHLGDEVMKVFTID